MNVKLNEYFCFYGIDKFYLVDVGYLLRFDLITSYKNTKYYLKEYSHCAPKNAELKELLGSLKRDFPLS